MRKISNLNGEILTVLDRYKDKVYNNLDFSKIYRHGNKFGNEGRPLFATGIDCLRSMDHMNHVGYPPDSDGIDLTINGMKQPMEEGKTDYDQYKKAVEYGYEVDEGLMSLIGFRNPALKMFYPEDGYIAWHTNWNAVGMNIIFTYSPSGKGYWRHINPEGSTSPVPNLGPNKEEWSEDHPNFVHIQDPPGWHCKVGYYGKKEEHDKIVWHSAASNGEKRITLGFIVYEPEMWEPMVEELVEYDNSMKNN